ncbi:MAG: DUF5655 domain-containing protein [Bryobacteraceae bacterium]
MAKITSIYSVHPSVAFVTNWRESLKEKTGRSLSAWLALVKASGPPGEKERIAWLKQEHRLGTNSAIWIAQRASGKDADMDSPESYLKAAERYVKAMFRGPYSPLRLIYDELLRLGLSLGEDVKACPCRTMVPLYRNHVFAQIKPATRTRIDFGFALGARKGAGRLTETGGYAKKDRITHRIGIESTDQIDAEVKHWLKVAYGEDVD